MKNRSVSDATKYTLTPWGGGTAVDYQIVFSGTVGVEGDPLNASTLISDDTGALYGLADSNTDASMKSTPNNAFRIIDERFDALLDFFYPIGTIYQTDTITTAEGMAAHFGGTWAAWGVGKVPVGYSSGDTDFGTVNATGGSKTSIQAHVHALDNHTHTVNTTTLTTASDGGSTSGSTTPGNTGANSVSHSHDYAHIHHVDQRGDHNHGSAGSHDHSVRSETIAYTYGSSYAEVLSPDSARYAGDTADAGSHTHATDGLHGHYTDTQDDHVTSVQSANHTHTSAAHTHTTPNHTHNIPAHAHTLNLGGGGATATAGTSGSMNLQPYQVCYFWKRTA